MQIDFNFSRFANNSVKIKTETIKLLENFFIQFSSVELRATSLLPDDVLTLDPKSSSLLKRERCTFGGLSPPLHINYHQPRIAQLKHLLPAGVGRLEKSF